MTDFKLRRRSIELRHFEQRLIEGHKRSLLHHDTILRPLIRHGLQLMGLLKRGERNALQPEIRNLRFAFPSLPSSFCGFRILHLSDLHIDGIRGLAERVVEQIAPIEADLCVFTGDYRFATSGPCHNVYPEMRKIAAAVRSRHGMLGILGNHDYGEEAGELEDMGIRMLMNTAVEYPSPDGSLWVAGVDDVWDYDCADLPGALSDVPEGAFKILLAHSPDLIDEAAAADISLYLCGHTHAGQIRLPLIGAVLAPADCDRRFWQGTWKQAGMQGYTSSGIGCSLVPVRFRCPPEIGMIELRCARHASSQHCCANRIESIEVSA